MIKAIMISIQPQHAVNILNGDKDRELRKWIPKGYVGWVYAYVTKGKPFIYYGCHEITEKWSYILSDEYYDDTLNGKVVFRFWFDEYEEITLDDNLEICTNEISHEELLKQSCVDYNHLNNYFMNENGDVFGYAWHIKKLEIFDKPKKLSDFIILKKFTYGEGGRNETVKEYRDLTKPPQKFCYCYVVEE